MIQLDWYVDFLSPFPYLQSARLAEFPSDLAIRPRPILFAALLKHWGNKAPAEIPAKKQFLFRHALWVANRQGIPFRPPSRHPFNPLRPLRLAIAVGPSVEVTRQILQFIWAEGRDTENEENWRDLVGRLGLTVADANEAIERQDVKATLKVNTEMALGAGVFGVPTFVTGGNLFWGADATDLLLDYLADTRLLDNLDLHLDGTHV